MRAAILQGLRTISVERVPVPQPGPQTRCWLRSMPMVYAAPTSIFIWVIGLSQDLWSWGTRSPGTSLLSARVSPRRLGKRVSIEPNIPCGVCAVCTRGLGRICLRKQTIGQTRWGGLAEYGAVPHDYAWPIPETFALGDAATVEPTAVGVHAFNRAQVALDTTVAVAGAGGVGLLLVPIAVAHDRVIVLEPNSSRREAARAAGAAVAVPTPPSVQEAQALFEQFNVTTIFECAGLAATTQLCLDAAPPGSLIMLVGMSAEDVALNTLRFARRELVVSRLLWEGIANCAVINSG